MPEKRKEIFSNSEFILLIGFLLVIAICFTLSWVGFNFGIPYLNWGFLIAGIIFVISSGVYIYIKIRNFRKKGDIEKLQEQQFLNERQEVLKKIILRYKSIKVDELASLLSFNDKLQLKKWLLSIPPELEFYLEGDELVIPREKFTQESDEANDAIEKLMRNFKDFEEKGQGKM
ncbi:MAG TPA: hypothetical protein VMX55_07105 [candidate division Zixibacteria bacterium]|nr:hypothetical protein [candidate division Zixibacteria bacterium]